MPWLPGVGDVSWELIRADRAAQEYDDRLTFRWFDRDKQYVVFIKQEGGKPDYPVLSFGYEIPHPDYLKQKLYEHDTVRHGFEMLDRLNAENDRLKKSQDDRFKGTANETAQRLEHALRKGGMIDSGHVSTRAKVKK